MEVTPYILYTNIYTLEGSEPKTNKYVDMYLLWLTNIIKYANLQKTDSCMTFMDEQTYTYLNMDNTDKNTLFQLLKKQINNFIIIKYPVPKTHKEGMLRKYGVDMILEHTKPIESQHPIYMYLDIDVLIVRDIRTLILQNDNISNPNTKLFLRDEQQSIDHPNYYGNLITEADKQLIKDHNIKLPGFSAGIFGWQNNSSIKQFFNHLLHLALESDKEFYTIEQPFFNAALFHSMFYSSIKFTFVVMSQSQIAQNVIGAHVYPSCVLVNYCGEPGDQVLHWNKMYHQLLVQFLFQNK